MTFGTKIALNQGMLVLIAVGASVATIGMLRLNDGAARELRDSYDQTLTIKTMLAAANDYAEQIAELFVFEDDTEEVFAARDRLLGAVSDMETAVSKELLALRDEGDLDEIAEEQIELDRMAEIRGIVTSLETSRERIAEALASGRRAEAQEIYFTEVENRFDDALGRLLDEGIVREQAEVIETIGAIDTLGARLRIVSFVLVGLTLLTATVLSVFLFRGVLRPVAALSRGTEAVAQGDLSHRVEVASDDELGRLADRFNDMAEKVHSQRAALLEAKAGLEDEVAARTAELRDVADQQADLAEKRARVLADLSHELRTPLTVVRGKAEVTLRDPDAGAPEMRAALERIDAKAQQMSRLVDDMMFVARSEAGAIPIKRAPLVLQDVLADVLLDTHELSRRKDIAILPHQPAEPVRVSGDADRLRQAVLIPLDNAIRIAPGGSSVRVTLEVEDRHAVVSVSDEGPGFAAQEAERAFARFWRGDKSAGGRGRGSGLGLSIARWILDRHEGDISLENHKKGGATVRLVLPLLQAA